MTGARTVLITGGGRGIGAATARLAAAEGWAVGVNYRADASAADALVAEIRAAGGKAEALQADVADPAAIAALFDRAEAALGPLDAVVISAGVLRKRAALADADPAEIARIIRVNVDGALLTAREAARRLGQKALDAGRTGDRAIVLLSSAAARIGSANEFVEYAASKGAIDSATLGLAKELGPLGVRVNAVRPGLIETDMQADTGWAERAQGLSAEVPLRRPGRAEEVAAAILFLISARASYVSGALLDVTGGR